MDVKQVVATMLAPIRRRVDNMVARAVVRLVDDAKKMQTIQAEVLKGEVRDGVERFQEYGFTSVPLPGAEAVLVFANGDRSHGLAVAVDDRRYRLKDLAPGEVALYTDEGDSIILSRGRVIKVTAGAKLEVDAPEATFSGNLTVTGTITGGFVKTATGIDLGTHTHSGVTSGNSSTGGPQ